MQDADAGALGHGLRAAGRFLLRVPWPLALVLLGSWGLVIWDLSSHAVPVPIHGNLFWELLSNLAHAPLFGTLTLFLAALLLREDDGSWPRMRASRYAALVGLVTCYGVLDEWHQSRVAGRDSSALDVLTDALSAVLVLWVIHSLGRAELSARQLTARLAFGVLLCVGSAALALLS